MSKDTLFTPLLKKCLRAVAQCVRSLPVRTASFSSYGKGSDLSFNICSI